MEYFFRWKPCAALLITKIRKNENAKESMSYFDPSADRGNEILRCVQNDKDLLNGQIFYTILHTRGIVNMS
jgi:hypothetical protein